MNVFEIPAAAVEGIGWILMHSLWQFALVAWIARMVAQRMRRSSASGRYAMLIVSMLLLVSLPVATWQFLPGELGAGSAEAHESSDFITEPSGLRSANDSDLTFRSSSETAAATERLAAERTRFALPDSGVSDWRGWSWWTRSQAAVRPWLGWIVLGWSFGVVVCSLRPLLGWHTLRRLRRDGVSPVTQDVRDTMLRMAQRLGVRRVVSLLQSTLAQVPVVIGYLRPVILLPVSLATSVPPVQLEAILAHELAHVRRHDFLVNLLQTLIETLFFYHPAVWWLSRQIRIEREHCCDDLVVASLGNRLEYGRALLAIEECRERNAVLGLAATDGSLMARVSRILRSDSEANATRLNDRWPVSCVSLLCLAVALLLSMNWNLAATDDHAGRTRPANQPAGDAVESSRHTHDHGDDSRDELQRLHEPAMVLPDDRNVLAAGFANDGKVLVTVSTQDFMTICRWDVDAKTLISEIKLAGDPLGRSLRPRTVMLSGDCRRVAAATDAYVGIWDTSTGELSKTLQIPQVGNGAALQLLAGTPDLSVIVGSFGTPWDTAKFRDAYSVVWDVASSQVQRTITHKHGNDFHAISLSSDAARLATTNGDGATIWDIHTGQELLYLPNNNTGREQSDPPVSSLYANYVWSIQFSPSGKQLAISDILGVDLVDATSGKQLRQLDAPYRYSRRRSHKMVFSKDGRLLARVGTGDKSDGAKSGYVVPIWSTQTGQKLFELDTDSHDGAFSADGERFAGFSELQKGLFVWSLRGDAPALQAGHRVTGDAVASSAGSAGTANNCVQ